MLVVKNLFKLKLKERIFELILNSSKIKLNVRRRIFLIEFKVNLYIPIHKTTLSKEL